MKLTIRLFYVFSFLALTLSCFYSCKKGNGTSEQQQQLEWLNYTGKNEGVRKIIEQLKAPEFSRKLVSNSQASTPDWDKPICTGSIADSLSYMLVPLINSENIANEYIKISIQKSLKVQEVIVNNYERDYTDNKSLHSRAVAGRDFLALYKGNIKLPKTFSPDSAVKQIKEQSKKEFYSKKDSAQGRRLNSTLSSTWCTSNIDIYYSYDYVLGDASSINNYITSHIAEQLSILTNGQPSYQFYPTTSSLSIGATPEITRNLEFIMQSVLGQLVSDFMYCDVSITSLNINSDCPTYGPIDNCDDPQYITHTDGEIHNCYFSGNDIYGTVTRTTTNSCNNTSYSEDITVLDADGTSQYYSFLQNLPPVDETIDDYDLNGKAPTNTGDVSKSVTMRKTNALGYGYFITFAWHRTAAGVVTADAFDSGTLGFTIASDYKQNTASYNVSGNVISPDVLGTTTFYFIYKELKIGKPYQIRLSGTFDIASGHYVLHVAYEK